MRLRIAALALGLFAASSTVLADTLVLTNGRRIQGELTEILRRGAQVDEHRPTALQERYRVAGCERRGGDRAAVKRDDHFRAGTQLKNRHVFIRVEADMLERRAQIKVNGGTVARDGAGLAFEILRGFDFRPRDEIDGIRVDRAC